MLIKLKIKNIEKNFVYLQNKDNEELKVKRGSLPNDIKIADEIEIKLFNKEEQDQKSLGKEILNEILNTNDNK
ncbi:MAG TPA: hypothetical protein VJ926_01555 [Patescibacteria group bacterium]|nr:hypothetical protein [Patescibacteria group bacterium]